MAIASSEVPSTSLGSTSSLWVPFARQMIDRIVTGDYASGEAIPTEAQLCEEFGISRTVVREGIRVLVEKGLIRIARGTGTVVLAAEKWRVFDPDILSSRLRSRDRDVVLRDVLELRKGIEPDFAMKAARTASEMDLARLGARVAEMEEALGDVPHYVTLDGEFHQFIADLGGNALSRDIFRTMESPLEIQRALTSRIPGNPMTAHDQHLAIYRAIRDRDPDSAWAAMRDHLEWAERRLDTALTSLAAT